MVQSYTTRMRRHNDLPGEYCYMPSVKEFERMERAGEFLWTAEHGETQYGTTAESIVRVLKNNEAFGIMILVPDVLPRLIQFLDAIGEKGLHLPVFISAPGAGTLEDRLRKRGDQEENIVLRLSQARDWEREAIMSDIRYTFVDNEEERVDTAVCNIMRAIYS